MRITPIYNPQNIINNPPHITNQPILEHLYCHNQEFKANERMILQQKLKQEKTKDNILSVILIGMLAASGYALYKAYQKLKNGLKNL